MTDDKKIFDEDIIANYRQLSDDIAEGRISVLDKLENSTTIDNQTKILLRYVSHTSLDTLSLLCNLTAFNMALVNDIDRTIESLPEQFHSIKLKFRNLVKITKEEHDFDKWSKRVTENLSKGFEKSK
jgi:hypothetical protein